MSKTGDWVIREQERAALNQSHDLHGTITDLQTELAVVRATLAAAMAELRRLEWSSYDDESSRSCCPRCNRNSNTGHAPNCTLAAVLKRAGAGGNEKGRG